MGRAQKDQAELEPKLLQLYKKFEPENWWAANSYTYKSSNVLGPSPKFKPESE